MLTQTTLISSVAQIADPCDLAARDEALRTQRRRARLFPLGTRVFAAYRLEYQPHPYKHLFDPLQRVPLDEVCRYAGLGFTTEVYEVDADQTVTAVYHLVTGADGHTYHVLAGDLRGVEIEVPTAAVPATISPVCRALQLVEPLRQVLMRLVAHVALIAHTADRNLYLSGDVLHVGPHTITCLPGGVLVDNVGYALRISLISLRRLVKTLRDRLAASECARFLVDLRRECRALPGLAVSVIPRDGTITINSNRYPRLKVRVTPGAVLLAPYVSSFQQADGRRPAWTRQYAFSSAPVDLHAQLAAFLS